MDFDLQYVAFHEPFAEARKPSNVNREFHEKSWNVGGEKEKKKKKNSIFTSIACFIVREVKEMAIWFENR